MGERKTWVSTRNNGYVAVYNKMIIELTEEQFFCLHENAWELQKQNQKEESERFYSVHCVHYPRPD